MKLVTARQAAELTRVPVATVKSWARRGLLKSVRKAEHLPGKPLLYSSQDVLLAEREARRRDPTHRRQRRLASDLLRDAGWLQSGITPPS
ncbi:helix-turn-helix domain-containing protein [Kribbella sp. NPDC056861]|uniref:MerR family transcriptional regulator n=1 Tax=Kribbella sp. NPDC056861 TaxID=3154857 RepID=UPI00341FB6BE